MNEFSPIINATDEGFNKHLKDEDPFIIVYSNDWCPACQEYKPKSQEV
jgi:thiol-disulfide isomerase/thioredoxin